MDNIFFGKTDLKSCGENVILGKTVRIKDPELVEIGNNVIIDDFTYISGNVVIGNYTHVASGCTLQASTGKITIKDFVGIASGCRLFAASSNYITHCLDLPTINKNRRFGGIIEDIEIGNYCLIGSNSVVLCGSVIPEGVAFGALSLITKQKYLEWTLYFGENLKKKIRRDNKLIKKSDYAN